ncbi:MAG: hypothetical protein LE180_05985 [Endomicrobium sp.]|uniref:hypothetical protein n=1 Tax=Candidatus Endomicrobiellum pyrsonymphae TaxID=1408203 RepID=UPI00357F50B0|nr:hypothetical protein [Endomicrobium sp.]
MMTLHLRKCVSLFVCLSLLLSACSNSNNKLARNKVKLAYDICSNKGNVIVKVGEPITRIGDMNCVKKNGKATCTKKDNSPCELKKVELCNELGKDCKDFEIGVTPVPCNESSDKSKDACLPMKLREKKEREKGKQTSLHIFLNVMSSYYFLFCFYL